MDSTYNYLALALMISGTRTCTPVPKGGPCTSHDHCTTSLCDAVSATCASPLSIGSPCSTLLLHVCGGAGYCENDGKQSTCAERLPVGGSCTQHHMCSTGLCESGRAKCERIPAGGVCRSNEDCSTSRCDLTRSAPYLAVSPPCVTVAVTRYSHGSVPRHDSQQAVDYEVSWLADSLKKTR